MKSFTNKIEYKRDLNKIKKILDTIKTDNDEIVDDLVRTKQFIESTYEEFYNAKPQEQVNFAFLIPLRVSRFSDDYWVDVYDYMPALKYLSKNDAYNVLVKLPPTSLEMYGKTGHPSKGVLIFVPIFQDMINDYNFKPLLKYKINKIIDESVQLAKTKHDVTYVGLGAMLPKLTNYGKTIRQKVITTTGHAGTVWLLTSTVASQIENKYAELKENGDLTIGFIGGGAIGSASMISLAKLFPNAQFAMHDKRSKINQNNLNKLLALGVNAKICTSNDQLITESQVIVSAITTNISLGGLSLKNKVIVDDSQPGSFSREEVIAADGELIWVVGTDTSHEQIATRRSGYSYGPVGLHHNSDVWGCEAEVASIAYFDARHYAVQGPVKPIDVENIGKLFNKVGIKISESQSYGQKNSIK